MRSGASDRALSRYFAYGSNLSSARLLARVASPRAEGAAWLDGHCVCFGKLGRDGSGKANLVEAPGGRVWGVVYAIDPADWPTLDVYEPGYHRISVTLVTADARCVVATTYRAPHTAPEPVALASYKETVIAGALEHGLPADYVDGLRALPARPDPLNADARPASGPRR